MQWTDSTPLVCVNSVGEDGKGRANQGAVNRWCSSLGLCAVARLGGDTDRMKHRGRDVTCLRIYEFVSVPVYVYIKHVVIRYFAVTSRRQIIEPGGRCSLNKLMKVFDSVLSKLKK